MKIVLTLLVFILTHLSILSQDTTSAVGFSFEADSLIIKGKTLKESNSYKIEIINISKSTIAFDTLNFRCESLISSPLCFMTNDPDELGLDEADKIAPVLLTPEESITFNRILCSNKITIHFFYFIISYFSKNEIHIKKTNKIQYSNFYW